MTSQGGVTVLVTGGAGFLGQHIVRELMEQDDFPIKEIRTFDIQPFKWHHGLQPTKNTEKLYHIEGSILKNEDVLRAFQDVDAVFHACSIVAASPYPNKKAVRAVNVDGTKIVLQACVEQSVECLVYTSTMDVANTLAGSIVNGTEESVTVPPTQHFFPVYSTTKYEAEKMVLDANETELKNGKKLTTCALRPCGIYGEGDRLLGESLAVFVNAGIGFLIGEPTGKSQYAYAGNIALAHVLAAKTLLWPSVNDPICGRAFFLGDHTPRESIGKIMEPFATELGVKMATIIPPYWLMYTIGLLLTAFCWIVSFFKYVDIPFHAVVVRYLYAEYTYSWEAAKRALDYEPKYTYEDGFARSMVFYKHLLGIDQKTEENKKKK